MGPKIVPKKYIVQRIATMCIHQATPIMNKEYIGIEAHARPLTRMRIFLLTIAPFYPLLRFPSTQPHTRKLVDNDLSRSTPSLLVTHSPTLNMVQVRFVHLEYVSCRASLLDPPPLPLKSCLPFSPYPPLYMALQPDAIDTLKNPARPCIFEYPVNYDTHLTDTRATARVVPLWIGE
jgi:hypothetical protein